MPQKKTHLNQKKYTVFTDIINRREIQRTIYLRIVKSEKDNQDEEKAF